MHQAASNDDAHDAGFAHKRSVGCLVKNGGKQTRFEAFNLSARISKARQLNYGGQPNAQPCAHAKAKKRKPTRCDVLAHLPRRHGKAFGRKFIKQLRLQKMNLPQVGLARVLCHTGPMLHRNARVGVAFHPVTNNELYTRLDGFGEGMVRTGVNGENSGAWLFRD